MSWLLWRQHRLQLYVTTGIVAAFAVAVLLTGVHMAHVYDDYRRTCSANGTCDLLGNPFAGYGAIVDTVHLSLIVPVVFGIFGAVLVSREVEQSTHVLAWTQTVTRRRWLTTKFAAAISATIVISGVVAALVTWWSGTPNALYGNRFQGAEFDTQNVLPIAFAFFALALGLAFGAWLRRALPAIAATLGVFIGLRVLVAVYLRPHYQKAITATYGIATRQRLPSGTWVIGRHLIDGSGRSADKPGPLPAQCVRDSVGPSTKCLDVAGFREVVTYQPAHRYWHFQLVEAGLFVVLGIALVVIAYVITRRRDA